MKFEDLTPIHTRSRFGLVSRIQGVRRLMAIDKSRMWLMIAAMVAVIWWTMPAVARAADGDHAAGAERPAPPTVDIKQMFKDGGAIGYVIVGLSLIMLALVFEHLLTIRRGTLIPRGMAEDIQRLIQAGQFKVAEERCSASSSLLGYLLGAGLSEVELGYSAVEKAMEDAAAEQSARLMRKIEYLSIISTVAPMLGLMGTVWGMILAFMEFERKANPQVSELAPGIYKALVTTLFGLIVAIPAISAFGYFRNRIDELLAQTALTAEHVFAEFKRSILLRKREERRAHNSESAPVARKEPKNG